MKITTSFKNFNWVAAGSIGGIITGAAVNLLKTGSFLEKDPATCKNPFFGFYPFVSINNIRENDLRFIHKNRFAPTPFSWFYPTIHIVPMLGYCLWNTCTKKTDKKGIKSLAKTGWSQLSKNVIYPSLHTILLTKPSLISRDIFFNKFFPKSIDVSGHVIVQIALTIHAINSLKAITETGTSKQKKLHSMICAIVALSDGIWMYNATASCHSIDDVVSGIAVVSLVHFSLQLSQSLMYKGFCFAKVKYQERAISITHMQTEK